MTTAEADYVKAKTSVWWDIENCEVPKIRDANTIVQNMISALSKMNYCGPVSIFACGDINLIPLSTVQSLSSTGVRLNHVPAGVKDASDKKILVDMLLWAMDNPAPANIMLISGDRDFSYALHHLGMRQYNIILAQPPHASAPLVAAAKNVWLWTSLAAGGPPLPSVESSQLVNNIPCYVSNKEVSNHIVAEQAQSSKPTDSILDAGDTKVYRTRNKYVPKGLLQETRQNMLGNSSGTTGESFQLVNNGRCHASDYEVPKYPVSEQHQSSKPTYSTSYSGGSPQDKIRNISQNGEPITASRIGSVVSDSSVNFTKPLADKRNISQVAFVDSHKAQASVSAKPLQEALLVGPVSNTDANKKHTCGKIHRSNLELQSGKCKNNLVGPVEPSKEIIEKHNTKKKAIEIKAKANSDFTCRMCNVVCHTQTLFDCHLRAKKHADMLTQSEALIDSKKFQEKGVGEKDQPREVYADSQLQSQENTKFLEKHVSTANQSKVLVDPKKLQEKGVEEKDQPKEITVQPKANAYHVCRLCNVVCLSQIDVDSHLRGQKHAAKLNQSKALTDSKKLQEEGVREKDQPRETNAEPPNARSRRSKKHVVMVNESEVLVDPKKLQQKGVQEKDQPREITVQPKANASHVCRLCNVVCQSQIVFDSHLRGQKHAAKLNQSKALIDSKKLQEEGVRGKDQPRETNAHHHNLQENSKCSQKHVVMVNESEELINARKLEEKDVRDKAQSVKTIPKHPSQSQNIQIPNGGSFSDFEEDREARECFDGIVVKPVNLSKGAAEHSREVKMRKEMMAAFAASNDAQSSVSTKPVKEPVGLQPVWCQVCQISCNSKVFADHIYGKQHQQNLELQSAEKNENLGPVKLSKDNAGETKKVPCNTFDRHLKSQNHSAMVTEQAEALVVDSREIREETKQEITEALKERHIISENLLHRVFPEQNRESRIPNEPRGCLDVIPERVKQPPNVSEAKKLEDESQHPGDASKKEEIKDQTVDNFWTRLWGKKR